MTLSVELAGRSDLAEAERLMREVLETDLGGYREAWHGDVDDLATAYLRPVRSALFVARLDGAVVGTAAMQPCRLMSPPNPVWLAAWYSQPEVCELRRVWVHRDARRRGVARALVRQAVRWATTSGGYTEVYLHTDTGSPGAERFWRSMPTLEIYDARPDPYNCVHFVLDVAATVGLGLDAAATTASGR
ncbi:MAG: GNAT family N-acetyltransferase [Dermatophilaceae bacterium]